MVSNAYYPADPRLRRQAETLLAHGYAVEVLCQRQPTESVEENILGVHVRRVGGIKYRGASVHHYLSSNLSFFFRVLLTLTLGELRHGYAAVQVYSMPEALVFTALWPRLRGVPLIYDAGDLTTELYPSKFGPRGGWILSALLRAQERLCLGFADLIITVHEEYRRRLLARGVAPERLRIAMNLPDRQLFKRALSTPAQRHPEHFTLVHHGSLVRRYGVDVLLRAVACLRDSIPSLRLQIYGDGDFRPYLAALIDEFGLADYVTLTAGYVPLEELLPLLACADVAIVPHRADPFTDTILPNKLFEYLALGLPTVVTRTQTVLLHIPDGVVEYCEPNDVEALAQAIRRLWAAPAYRQALAAKAQAFGEAHWWDEVAAAYCADVDAVVASHGRFGPTTSLTSRTNQ